MAVSRVNEVDRRFREAMVQRRATFVRVERQPGALLFQGNPLTQAKAVELLECMISSRWIDYVARDLKNVGEGYYTIGSTGHEGNAMVGQLTRYTDPAFLHYRSGNFVMARARQLPGETPVFDTCLSLTAAAEDPIAGGRHKVWGSKPLNIPPQTSTIASHLPKAMGMAIALERRQKLGKGCDLPSDAIVVCSFGDASSNHSTAVGAINAASWCAFQHMPVPVLFVCEDNGIGISVKTPNNWVASNYGNRAGLQYFSANGLDIAEGYGDVARAVDFCRKRRRPVFLHLRTVRLLGHAGTDVEIAYRDKEEIEAAEALDPLITTALRLIDAGVLSPDEILDLYEAAADRVRAGGEEAKMRPKHETAATVMAPLYPDYNKTQPRALSISSEARQSFWGDKLPEAQKPRHMAQLINWGLQDLFAANGDLLLFGEDVARKGGVYNVSAELWEKFGAARVFNTLLDEQSILGLAMGAGHAGLLPMPEIQYLAYLHNAIDQLRGEACSLQYFSEGRFTNPMVVRIAGLAYQKGFGGHFHNDNSFSSIREIPGIIMVTASNGPDAVRLMRCCVDLARQHGAVVAFIEPIALYMVKDLVGKGDYNFAYPGPEESMAFGEVGDQGPEDAEILLISYANGTYLSLQAMHDAAEQGIKTRLLDLRFLTPLNRDAILAAARGKKSVIIVDECRRTASLSEEITSLLVENFQDEGLPHITRICGEDTYIPLGKAWEFVLPSRQDILQAIQQRAEHG